LTERIGLACLDLFAVLAEMKSGFGRFGLAAMDNKVFQLLAWHAQKRFEPRRKGFAGRVGNDKVCGQVVIDIGFAVDAS
jgi:hypothetical protein